MAVLSMSSVAVRPSLAAARPARQARRVVARAAAEPPTPAPETEAPPPPPKKDKFPDLFNFGSYGPELFNGRLAMLGFVAGVGAEITTGESTLSQFGNHTGAFVFASALFTLASLMPRLQGGNTAKPDATEGAFTASAEMLNGRAAMIGMAALLIQESISGSAVF